MGTLLASYHTLTSYDSIGRHNQRPCRCSWGDTHTTVSNGYHDEVTRCSQQPLSACGEGKQSLGTIRFIKGGLEDKITWSQRCEGKFSSKCCVSRLRLCPRSSYMPPISYNGNMFIINAYLLEEMRSRTHPRHLVTSLSVAEVRHFDGKV
jgi:hypothetical protein